MKVNLLLYQTQNSSIHYKRSEAQKLNRHNLKTSRTQTTIYKLWYKAVSNHYLQLLSSGDIQSPTPSNYIQQRYDIVCTNYKIEHTTELVCNYQKHNMQAKMYWFNETIEQISNQIGRRWNRKIPWKPQQKRHRSSKWYCTMAWKPRRRRDWAA